MNLDNEILNINASAEKLTTESKKEILNKNETNPNENGINLVFGQNPELEKIGTKEEYWRYLENIFPNSKVKDIVYHISNVKFETFDDNKRVPGFLGVKHYFSSTSKPTGFNPKGYGEIIHPTLINLKSEKDIIKGLGESVYGVENSSQTHILGSKQDVEDFKKFVNQKSM